MDVHINNWKFCSKTCDLLIHVFLPSKFLSDNNISVDCESLMFYVQTRYTQTLIPSKYVHVWGQKFTFNISKKSQIMGLAISLPICLTSHNQYNPWNITTLKIVNRLTGVKQFVHFFHLTLLQSFMSTRDILIKKLHQNETEVLPQETMNEPLDAIFKTVAKKSHLDEPLSPLKFLSGLLKSESVFRHHQALENPGDVRGLNKPIYVSPKQIPPLRLSDSRPVYIKKHALNAKDLNMEWSCTTNIISKSKFFVCVYDKISDITTQYHSMLDNIPLEQLTPMSPINALLNNISFLESKQYQCVDSLERTCLNQNLTILQKLAINFDKSSFTTEALQDHFLEACFIMRQCISEQCAWIEAAIAKQNNKNGIWVDFFQLWGQDHNLGVYFSSLCDKNISDEEMWVHLLTNNCFTSLVTKCTHACLVVVPTLICYLLLPGGFVIKGSYTLSYNDLLVVNERYG
ncbi:ORF32 [Felid gammaherpesvirus 1]|uniref:ORF32 n=1 Tax=Felid gammaherpesvirus 1 TaxID=2560468 RepID=A0A0M5KXP4_9GAMA|nr:ORF32 [Felis catus gammaherpesvirus 1]ALE14744.1 ORF32 [Felis catus gammaherpesvirus 1]